MVNCASSQWRSSGHPEGKSAHLCLAFLLRVSHPRVQVQLAKVAGNLLLSLEADVGKVLVAQDDGASLSAQQRELVEACLVELGLHTHMSVAATAQ